ncbi:MAG: DUF84 family protein, partial [Planctomycetes bacterium]|nr:DUF84 family protein [Planctomycetota bacterium]
MIVRVGSTNPVKVRAARRAFRLFFPKVRVEAVDVNSRVPRRPSTLAQIVRGARERATRAHRGGDFGVGIEAGTFRHGGKRYVVTIACVTDGRRTRFGGGPFFEYDPKVKASDETGLVGALTRRRITREEVTRWAVAM